MSKSMKTPGVYINELDAFGNAIVSVSTAIPAFIGYTEKTAFNGNDLLNKPVKIQSLTDFLAIFGNNPPNVRFAITASSDDKNADITINTSAYTVKRKSVNYRLYAAMKFFYANGGADCYVTSIGTYDYAIESITDTTAFSKALKALEKEMEPTMLVIPDVVEVYDATVTDKTKEDYLLNRYKKAYSLQQEMINHCGKMMSRFAILDVPGGFTERLSHKTSVLQFRESVEPEIPKYNSYAAAYYPWLHTTIYQSSEVGYQNIHPNSYDTVISIVKQETTLRDSQRVMPPEMIKILSLFTDTPDLSEPKMTLNQADSILKNESAFYQQLIKTILTTMNLMAPSAAMAGIYTAVDTSNGVWKAPANVGIQSVISPAIKIDQEMQEGLNVPLDGKSICAIRSFPGLGVLVWGARTLDGNSNDWRYINVRRTLIYIEQSVKDASKAYVFAANDVTTWTTIRSMISNFLTGLWNQGGLAGPKPADAFSVSIGLGTTMTHEDIQQGIMRVVVKVAVSRPAEFIVIAFQQQMQQA